MEREGVTGSYIQGSLQYHFRIQARAAGGAGGLAAHRVSEAGDGSLQYSTCQFRDTEHIFFDNRAL